MENFDYLNELNDSDELLLRRADTTPVKYVGDPADMRVGGYLVVWGSPEQRDLQGEYFTPETDLRLDWYDSRPALYHHGLDGDLQSIKIGKIDTLKMDEVGVWAEAQLDMHKQYVQMIQRLVDKGILGWSSGSLRHLVKTADDGRIILWPIVEGSLTPAPAEPFRTTVGAIKSALASVEPDATKESLTEELPTPNESNASTPAKEPTLEVKMDPKQMLMGLLQALLAAKPDIQVSPEEADGLVNQVLSQMQAQDATMSATTPIATPEAQQAFAKSAASLIHAAAAPIIAAKEQTRAQQQTIISNAMKGHLATVPPPAPAPMFTGKGHMEQQPTITDVRDVRYDYLSPEDLIFGAHVLQASNKPVSETFLRAAATKMLQAGEKNHKVYSQHAVKSALPIKADEINATNLANFGQDWVGAAYETRIWEAIREAPMYEEVLRRGTFQVEVPQGVNTIYIPTEGTDPVWSTLVEQNDLDATTERLPITPKISTPTAPRRQLTVGGIAARIAFTDFMEEDALFPVLSFYRSRMEITAQEQIEFIMFNGDTDTTASTNINLIDSTPSLDAKGRGPSYLANNGILKLPLVTTAALSRDGGAFDETDFLETWKLLPAPQQVTQKDLMWVLDPFTYMAALNITAFKSRDVFNPATVESGQIKNVYGIDAFRTGQIAKANLAGKISNTPANNTKGRLLLILPRQWVFGWKRQVRTESARDIDSQATVIVSTLRFGITYRAATGGAALSYNLTI